MLGPTTLGNHQIIGVQNLTEVRALLTITSTQQVDDRNGNLAMGPDKDAALLAAGYAQLYPPLSTST